MLRLRRGCLDPEIDWVSCSGCLAPSSILGMPPALLLTRRRELVQNVRRDVDRDMAFCRA